MKELDALQKKLMDQTAKFSEHLKDTSNWITSDPRMVMSIALLAQTVGTLNDMVRMIEHRLDQIEAREQTEDMENSEKERG